MSMLKKIPVSALRVGMYIAELDCDWLAHPFLRNSFKLASSAQLEKLIAAGIRDVYIDSARGLDMPDAPTAAEVQQALQQEMIDIASATPPPIIRVSVAEEMTRAQSIRGSAQRLVRSVMSDARLGKAVQLEEVQPLVARIADSILSNHGALIGLLTIKDKDNYTFLHCVSVCALMVAFARSLQLDDDMTRQAGMGGLLHDTGKALVDDAILNKPGKLTDEEFAIIKRHPRDGFEILSRAAVDIGEIPLDITLHHHERLDAAGYPDRLPADKISQLVRMSSIVDVYDAITSDRSYHRGMPATDALRKLHEWSAHHLDPALVQGFIRCVGIYPVGSLVRLESGRLAVVIDQNRDSLLQPLLKVVFNTRSNAYVEPYELDLARPLGFGGADRILNHEDPAQWGIDTRPYVTQ